MTFGAPSLRAGTRLSAPDGSARATLGLLVSDGEMVFGLSVLKLAHDGAQPVWNREAPIPLGPAVPLCSDGDSAVRLLARIEISDELMVSPVVSGIANMKGPIDAVDALDRPVVLSMAVARNLGRIIAFGRTVAFRDGKEGARSYYSDAIEIDLGERGRIPPGAAGALICTSAGKAIGIVIGATESRVYAAPLFDVLAKCRLKPLTWEEASRHNGRVEDCLAQRVQATATRGTRGQPQPGGPERQQSPPRLTSKEIYKRYNPKQIVKIVEMPLI